MKEKEVAIKKYNAINRANRTMFTFVAIASVILGAATVGIIFLSQKISFKGKIISEQTKTLTAIDKSSDNVDELIKKVKLLRTNSALSSVKKIEGANNLQAVVDALPKVGNAAALGSSLSDEILAVPGLSVESINIDPIAADNSASTASSGSTAASASATTVNSSGAETKTSISEAVKSVGFSISVSAKSGKSGDGKDRKASEIIQEFLKRMEKSIRTLSVNNITFEITNENQISVNVTGRAFYLPDDSIKLSDKTIKSNENAGSTKSSPKNNNSTGGKK